MTRDETREQGARTQKMTNFESVTGSPLELSCFVAAQAVKICATIGIEVSSKTSLCISDEIETWLNREAEE